MKKIYFALMFSIFSLTAFAQGFGVRAGLNLAKMTMDPNEGIEMKNKMGFQVGVEYEMEITESIFFNPALLYSIKGSNLEVNFFGETFDAVFTLNYIDFPLDFVYKIGMESMNIGVFAGPYLGYFLSGEAENGDGEKEDLDKDDIKSLDYGLDLGVGLYLDKINVRVFYQLGLANIDNSEIDEGDEEFSLKNNVLGITAGYRF